MIDKTSICGVLDFGSGDAFLDLDGIVPIGIRKPSVDLTGLFEAYAGVEVRVAVSVLPTDPEGDTETSYADGHLLGDEGACCSPWVVRMSGVVPESVPVSMRPEFELSQLLLSIPAGRTVKLTIAPKG